jgi:hypothetical protein
MSGVFADFVVVGTFEGFGEPFDRIGFIYFATTQQGIDDAVHLTA